MTAGRAWLLLVVAGLLETGWAMGTGYAVWTGFGAVGAVILGIVLLGESRSAARLVCLALIVAGIVGLRLAAPAE